MARKPNYSFEKRKKELDRKAKQEEKARRKAERGPDTEPYYDEATGLIVNPAVDGATDETDETDDSTDETGSTTAG